MKTTASLALAAVFAATALAVPSAEAHARKPTALRTSLTVQLRIELHATQTKLAHAAAQLAKIRRELTSSRVKVKGLRAQASRLQATLTGMAGHLKAAQTQAAGVRAKLAAIPKPLAVAVEQVRREVAYVQGGVPYSQGQLVSEAALDYVAGHVSDTAYGYLEATGGHLPASHPGSVLSAQAGICHQAAVTFAALVGHFGLQARSVQFFYDDPGSSPTPDQHIAVEVFYDGSWHFFDPTFGQFWTDSSGLVLSVGDVRAGLGLLQKNVASFTNVFEDATLGNDSWFETDPTTTVVIGAASLIG